MGLFGVSKGEQERVIRIIDDYITYIEKQFVEIFSMGEEREEEKIIFSGAINTAHMIGMKKLANGIRKSKISAEAMALNILQNTAMQHAMNGNQRSVLLGDDVAGAGYTIYNFANEIKLQNGYIDGIQYEENKRLIKNIWEQVKNRI